METYKIKLEFIDGAPIFSDGEGSSRNLNIVYGEPDPRVRPDHYDIEFRFVVYFKLVDGIWHADWIAEDYANHEYYKDKQSGLEAFVHKVNNAIKTLTPFEFTSDDDYFKDFKGMMFWVWYYGEEICP